MKKNFSLIINIIITILTLIALIVMFTGIKITNGIEPILETTKLGMLKFFTVDPNILMGIVALIFVILQVKNKEITKNMYRLKLMATTSVTITFIVVFTYLGPISEHGIKSLLQNSNIFFHLIIPILSIINFTIFEKTNKLNHKDTLYGLIPTIIYAIAYTTNLLIHIENGKVLTIYDWYWFAQNGLIPAIITALIILITSYIISTILWKLNKRS